MMVMTLHIALPMFTPLNVDMVWFGIVMVILLELSLITPPVSMNLFVLQGVRMRTAGATPGKGLLDLYIGYVPFLVAMLTVLALVIAFPSIAMWLVSTAKFTV